MDIPSPALDASPSQTPEQISSPPRRQTRLQSGIVKPKKLFPAIERYGQFCATGEPETLQEALGDSKWRQAMEDKYNALIKNQTWHLVEGGKGTNVIDCKMQIGI